VNAMPTRFRRWPRGLRIAIYATLILLTIVAVIPAMIVGVGYVAGFAGCYLPETSATSGICSAQGRLLLMLVLIGVGLPVVRAWNRFLVRTLDLSAMEPSPTSVGVGNVPLSFPARASIDLLGWQTLHSGTIEHCAPSDHTVLFEGIALTFWSLYPLQNGWLRQGDRTVIVFQRIPFSGMSFALAYVDARTRSVRAVAPRVQIAAVLIAVACIAIFALLRPALAEFWITLCCVFVSVNALYLVFMLRAQVALRNFIASSGSVQ
jgi:hypothetical protein